ncbi:lyase family protein [Thalassospira alkalitolerans]|uniref:lyase family protein n=1 Tax=Thalassospira alkalitolerans TaxID=1293890 RepID=UPI003AA86F13
MTDKKLPATTIDLFTKTATWQSWLNVEGALAQAQGDLGMIPVAASDEIRRHLAIDGFDLAALERDIEQSMSPIMTIVRALAAKCDGDAGGYVHWGATTQNIIITGKVLQLRKAHAMMLSRLANSLDLLADLAKDTADWPTVSRTNRRQALPITFGYKVAGWIDEFLRCAERLREVEKRTFTLIFGGASGAMHSYGKAGYDLARRMGELLGLGVSDVHSRAANDGLGEYITTLGLFAVACERIGTELYTLMSNEFDEVREIQNANIVGSSTMPHKTNPKYVVALLSESAGLRSMAAPALEACRPSHEGDAAYNFRLYDLIDTAGISGYGVATKLETLLRHIKPNRIGMTRNLMANPAPLMSEKIMLELATETGRQNAHDIVHHAIVMTEKNGVLFEEALFREPAVQQYYGDIKSLQKALDPTGYTGCSSDIALDSANRATNAGQYLRGHIDAFETYTA